MSVLFSSLICFPFYHSVSTLSHQSRHEAQLSFQQTSDIKLSSMSDSGPGCHLSQRIQIGESKQLLIGVSFTGCLFTIRRTVEKGERMMLLIG